MVLGAVLVLWWLVAFLGVGGTGWFWHGAGICKLVAVCVWMSFVICTGACPNSVWGKVCI